MKLFTRAVLVLLITTSLSAYTQSSPYDALKKAGVQPFASPSTIPDFSLLTLEGKKVALSDYRGTIVFLNFWATWCPPCRAEMPSMQKLYDALKNKPFVILAVSLGEKTDTVKRFIASNPYTFPILLDSDGALANVHSVTSIPTTLIIDKSGKLIGKAIGSREWNSKDVIAAFAELADKK